MHLLLHMSILLTASAAYVPLRPRVDPCEQEVEENEDVELDGPTSDRTAGIGAEFESPIFYFVNRACSAADINAAKRAVVAGRTGTNWELTADTGSDAGMVYAEYILDGRSIKVGSGDGAKAGAAAAQNLIGWHPWTALPGPNTVDIANNNCNPWTIDAPDQTQDPVSLEWDPQITAPMPLEALYSLMKEQLADPEPSDRNILDGICTRTNNLIVVTQDYFQSNRNGIDRFTVSDDVLGFCSLVLSYAKIADNVLGSDTSPKLFLTFMPRTEFNTIYQQVRSKIPGDLFTLFNSLACYKTDDSGKVVVDTDYCSGPVSRPLSKSKFAALSYTNRFAARVNIRSWIQGIGLGSPSPDRLTTFDASIDGSMGGLGTQMEKMFNSQRSVPLFEFRDLLNVQTSGFESFMAKADSSVQALHKTFANPPAQKRKRQAPASCMLTASTSGPSSTSTAASTTAVPSMSCQYQNATPETSEACTCMSGSSTTVVQPMSLPSVSIVTQGCEYTTWPGNRPSVTEPPQTVSTNFAGCQVCTVVGPNEDNCSPLPTSLGCIPEKSSTILSADTSGVTVGTLTGSAFYSAITSAIDQVCEVPPNNGGSGSFTCTETATATLAADVKNTAYLPGETGWSNEGILTLQITEASYDSLEWYATNKAIIAALAQNSTQGNCKSITALGESGHALRPRIDLPPGPVAVEETFNICQAGSNFQLIEVDTASAAPARELSFDLRFQAGTEGDIVCEFLEDVIEFIETTVAAETDTEATIPEEVKIDQKLLDACEGITP